MYASFTLPWAGYTAEAARPSMLRSAYARQDLLPSFKLMQYQVRQSGGLFKCRYLGLGAQMLPAVSAAPAGLISIVSVGGPGVEGATVASQW